MQHASIIEVDLAAISRNMHLLRKVVGPDVRLCPIVKADGYGLGATRLSKTLVAAGADMLAVYTPEQAVELFNTALSVPILVLMPVREVQRMDDLYRGFICGKLHLTVHDEDQLSHLIALAERFGAAIPVHLEIDTGMSRGGCSLDDAPHLLHRITTHPRLTLAGLFTHFANAEDDMAFTDEQHSQFTRFIERHENDIPKDCLIHVSNTFATMRSTRFHHSMVRIGLAWAGYCLEEMSGGEVIVQGEQLQPAITWASSIVQLKRITTGTPVGYGSKWRAERDSIIGLVPVGYADGYPIAAGSSMPKPGQSKAMHRSEPAWVAVVFESSKGRFVRHAPVVGAVNMDQITIDLTDVAESLGEEASLLKVDTRVELITPDITAPNHLPRLADRCGTFAHEIICRLNSRLRRVYKQTGTAHVAPSQCSAVA